MGNTLFFFSLYLSTLTILTPITLYTLYLSLSITLVVEGKWRVEW